MRLELLGIAIVTAAAAVASQATDLVLAVPAVIAAYVLGRLARSAPVLVAGVIVAVAVVATRSGDRFTLAHGSLLACLLLMLVELHRADSGRRPHS